MSASPPQPTHSVKRPLEEASSPSVATDQPDAKRPALDKTTRNEDDAEVPETDTAAHEPAVKTEGADQNGAEIDVKVTETADMALPETKTATTGPTPTAAASAANAHDETLWIHIRAVISSPEAATIIGKGGENVSNIRKMSNAKCTVSDYQKGAVERILTVSGVVDAVAKAFGLIIRTLNNEPLGEPSTASSKTYPLRLLIPHMLIGSIIGKGGARIREIQDASGARLNASDSCLPGSSERSLVVMGVADAVHIATYYVGSTLLEQLNERYGGPAASAYATRSGAPAGPIPGGMAVVPYNPRPAGGQFGRPEHYQRNYERRAQQVAHAYGQPYAPNNLPHPAMQPIPYGGHPPAPYGAPIGQPQVGGHAAPQAHAGPQGQPVQGGIPGTAITQQIFIPNDMVGAIIGKGGQKINEIRTMSGSVIKINEPQDNSNERLVTITGSEECNRMALYMLYSRLESEKHRA